MDTIVVIVGVYMMAGLLALVLFDWLTGRVRHRLGGAFYDTQSKLMTGRKTSIGLTVIALWVFWLAVIGIALIDWLRSLWE